MFEIETIQYGEFRDTLKYNDLEALLNDIANIEEMGTIQVLDIRENGKSVSKTKEKVIRALAKVSK